jgi:hypothetical protein
MREPAETVHGRPAYPGSTSHDTDGQRTGRGQILAITTKKTSTRSSAWRLNTQVSEGNKCVDWEEPQHSRMTALTSRYAVRSTELRLVPIRHPFCEYLNARWRPRTFSSRWRGRHHGPTDASNAVIDCAGMRLYVVVTSEVERLAHRMNVSFRKQRANIGLKARWVGHAPSPLRILRTVLQLHHRFGHTTMPYYAAGPDPRAGFMFIECTSVRRSRFFRDAQSAAALNRSPTPAGGRGASLGRSDLPDPLVAPEAIHATESWNAALRASSCPGKNEDSTIGRNGTHG